MTTGRGKPEAGMVWAERLRLEAPIGRSAGSTVWKATCIRSGAVKALRLLPETMLLAPGSERDLRATIERYAAAKVAGVVVAEELIVAPGGAGIVLPWIEGRSLSDLRVEGPAGCLGASDVEGILVPLAQALDRIHAAGLFHGALKPTNVFRTADGRLVVGDCGSAWWVGEALMRLGSQVAVLAAMPYWSYERSMGDPASLADDLHALGAIAYELLAGRTHIPPNAMGMQQMGKPPTRIAVRRREAGADPVEIDETLEALVLRCLAREPGQRPPSFAAVLEALRVTPPAPLPEEVPTPVPSPPLADPPPASAVVEPPAPARVVAAPPVTPGPEEPAPAPAPMSALAPVPAPAPVSAPAPVPVEPPSPPALPEPQTVAEAPALVVEPSIPPPPAPEPMPEPARKPTPASGATPAAKSAAKPVSSLRYGEAKPEGANRGLVIGAVVAVVLVAGALYFLNAGSADAPAEKTSEAGTNLSEDLRREVAALPLDASAGTVADFQIRFAAVLAQVPVAEQAGLQAVWQDRRMQIERARAARSVGTLEVKSTPSGAEVWVGAERRGMTPLMLADLPVGRFAFELRQPGYASQTVEATIEGGRAVVWQGALVRAKGALRVESNTPGDAFEVVAVSSAGVVARGVTPQDLTLPEGEYRVAVERAGHRTVEQRVEVGAGGSAKVEARFPEGRLKAQAPDGALFSVGGVLRGMAPLDLGLPPGEHVLSVEYPGGRKEERRVFVQVGQTLELRFQPAPEPKAETPAAQPDATSPPPPAPSPVDYNRVFELNELTRRPVPTNRVSPDIPQSFRRLDIRGEVEVAAIVDRLGNVTSASIVKSSHPDLDEPTLTAMRRWRFRPAEKDGRAVAVRVVVPFSFSVQP